LSSSSSVWAQSETKERPTLKHFGSSLKRVKWDPVRQAAVEIKSPQKRPEAETDDLVRVITDLVVCEVMVLDRQGRPVTGLTKDDFAVSEDGQSQEVVHFSLGSDANVGRSIVLIIDYSNSLAAYVERSIDAATELVKRLGPKDRMAIVTDDVELLVDFTPDKRRLEKALEGLKISVLNRKGRSEQFSALLATARELFDAEDIRPIVIFQTDGDQSIFLQPPDPVLTKGHSKSRIQQFSLGDVNTAVERARATVYAVVPGFRLVGLPKEDQLKRATIDAERFIISNGWGGNFMSRQPYHPSQKRVADWLAFRLNGQLAVTEVAKLSGGWTSFLEQPEQASTIYESILSDINQRLVIGYYSTNKTHDGKRRKVLIEVRNHPEYKIWGRKSYIAAGPD